MHIKKILLFFFLFFHLFFSYTEELNRTLFFTLDEEKRVLKGEIISRMYVKYDTVKENTDKYILIPRTKYVNEDFSNYEVIVDEKAFIPYKIENYSDKLKFYNILVSYSKLKGMIYYSRLRNKEEILILDAYSIKSPLDKSKITDPMYDKINEITTNYFLQKDNKFGKLTFKSEIYNENNNFVLKNTCVDKIATSFIEVCKEEEYKVVSYFIYSVEYAGFFYYSFNVMRVHNELFLKGNKIIPPLYPTTFSNRLRAATVHLAKLLNINWENKLNPWDEKYLKQLRKSKKEG